MWMNWWHAWVTSMRSHSLSGIILYDRYHADMLVDPVRYRYGGPAWAARLASDLMPKPDVAFFLDANPEVLLSRKQEVTRHALEQARAGYLELADAKKEIVIIDAGRPLKEVVADISGRIEKILNTKTHI